MVEAPAPAHCILCGKPATHQASLLLVPSRGYAGRPWRVEVTGARVCGACQKPLPDELLGVVDKLRASVGLAPFWDQLVNDIRAQKGPSAALPHRASTRAAYEPLEPARGAAFVDERDATPGGD